MNLKLSHLLPVSVLLFEIVFVFGCIMFLISCCVDVIRWLVQFLFLYPPKRLAMAHEESVENAEKCCDFKAQTGLWSLNVLSLSIVLKCFKPDSYLHIFKYTQICNVILLHCHLQTCQTCNYEKLYVFSALRQILFDNLVYNLLICDFVICKAASSSWLTCFRLYFLCSIY